MPTPGKNRTKCLAPWWITGAVVALVCLLQPHFLHAQMVGLSDRITTDDLTEFEERAVITSGTPIRMENEIAVAPGRTRVEYNQFSLEADRLIIDFVTEDIMADGNVIFTTPSERITADRGRFNLTIGEGVAYGVDGRSGDFFFRVRQDADGELTYDEVADGPAFRQINEMESVFRGMHFTTSDFPVPFYYVTATEIVLLRNDRIFMRNPVLWIRGVPVFWVPAYSQSLRDGSPWSIEGGYNSRLGAFLRIGYRYIHRVQTPDFDDPTEYVSRSHGQADFVADWMSIRGEGFGARYRYEFDYKRHIGFLEVYGLRDTDRNIDHLASDGTRQPGADEQFRWVYRHKHHSRLTESLGFQWNADLVSDADVYYDVLDRFVPEGDRRRGRRFEQRFRTAVTWTGQDAVARLLIDRRTRLSRDRYTDYSNPFDDDLDFDPDPEFIIERRRHRDGVPSDRFGTVSENFSARYATRLINLAGTPLSWRVESNAFSSLDSGFNSRAQRDDTRVNGVDGYGAVHWRWRLGERTTWVHTIGGGAAFYERESSDIVNGRDFARATPDADGIRRIDGVRFVDSRTIALGESDTRVSTDDTESYYVFGDYTSRVSHRFTNYLDGYVRYRIRRGTEDGLGEYYERIGRQEAFNDIHDFYTNHHDIEAGLNHYLRYPDITTSVYAGHNLHETSRIYPNQRIRYAGFNTTYRTPLREFEAAVGTEYQVRQIRDRGDPNAFEQGSIVPNVRFGYFPRHQRYWMELRSYAVIKTDEDPVERDARLRRRFDENATEIITTPIIGRQFGPKYKVQLAGTYNSRFDIWESIGVTIIRDLHDAELGLYFGARNDPFRDDRDRRPESDRRDTDYELEVRGSLSFKLGRDRPGAGTRSIVTLGTRRSESSFVR
ncbi:MAG: LPS-assembly protein LptD [Candidatus Sumerlaeia bacterium]|nr:LPS-assembly protein LptD [Candidatus Sumerlaeia bacterium]